MPVSQKARTSALYKSSHSLSHLAHDHCTLAGSRSCSNGNVNSPLYHIVMSLVHVGRDQEAERRGNVGCGNGVWSKT